MIALMPEGNPIGLKAIASVFQAMQDESWLKSENLTLKQYLNVSQESIGASIITAYLVSKLQIKPNIWYSNFLVT